MADPRAYGHNRDHRDDSCVLRLGAAGGLILTLAVAVRQIARAVHDAGADVH